MVDLQKLYDAILSGRTKEALAVTRQALEEGCDVMQMLSTYMIPAMDEVGKRFARQEYFIPEMLVAARAMKSTLELVRPLLAARGAQSAGRVIIGTVKGDLHDIGKNLVASMLEGGGFEVIDLGIDVPPEKFVSAAERSNADIVCLSALLTATLPAMESAIEALGKAGLRAKVKVMVGGAPLTQEYADQIGADGYGRDATAAVRVARHLMSGASEGVPAPGGAA